MKEPYWIPIEALLIAHGKVTRQELAQWYRENTEEIGKDPSPS
jgi:hypothetical protein